MSEAVATYDPRYLAGIQFFNAHDFFEAHEVWEDLWADTAGTDRRFYQALIQAAVALHHFGNGNHRGAIKLYRSSHAYMEPYPSPHLGLDIRQFWLDMENCFRGLLSEAEPERGLRPFEDLIPSLALSPPPSSWPDPEVFLREEENP